MCCNPVKLRCALQALRYEFVYWMYGTAALVDDIFYSFKNKLNVLPTKTGEVAVITGGTKGIGYEVVKKLLECDMHVIIGCLEIEDGRQAVHSIRCKGLCTGSTELFEVDTSSMKSVRNFARNVKCATKKINVLINNAGIMSVPFALTEDGFESQLCVNYLGHFLLTHLLLSTLKETGDRSENCSRIVNVSSCAHIPGSINFDDINYVKQYIPNKAYAQAKLAQLMFAKSVDRKLKAECARVLSFAVHPGIVNTALFNDTPLKRMAPWLPKLLFKTPEQGAVSLVFAAVSDSMEGQGGAYISNCRHAWISPIATNEELQDRLMNCTLEMLNIKEFGVDTVNVNPLKCC
ncbi:UNVERIFIED_CONTAM: hypothetical protein PYX00_005596 [Menopon gallinae]|uniref:Uncharacterized protein n=1 Tax=Menopon gallinae TaxID=328185 RepID=A0AAW2HRX5_9NEOP